MTTDFRYAIVIPALNESASIVDVVTRALRHSQNIIVIDDGSSDGTASLLSDLPVVVLHHEQTMGKAAGLVTGFNQALGQYVDAVITLDGDGQHRPEDIPKLLECSHREPEKIIIGSRKAGKAAFPRERYWANRTADFWISWASGSLIEDTQSGFRLYPRAVLELVRADHRRSRGFVFESEFLINAARAGYRCTSVDIPALYAGVTKRASHYRPIADVANTVVMVAAKLLSRGMYPTGLYRVIREWRENNAREN